MNISGIKRTKVNKIFLTHWHADHTAGLIGLLQTLGNETEPPKIDLFGPIGTKKRIDHLLAMTVYELRFELKVHEISPKKIEKVHRTEDYEIYASKMVHSTPCIGYSIVEKAKRKVRMEMLKKIGVPEGPHLQKLSEGEFRYEAKSSGDVTHFYGDEIIFKNEKEVFEHRYVGGLVVSR